MRLLEIALLNRLADERRGPAALQQNVRQAAQVGRWLRTRFLPPAPPAQQHLYSLAALLILFLLVFYWGIQKEMGDFGWEPAVFMRMRRQACSQSVQAIRNQGPQDALQNLVAHCTKCTRKSERICTCSCCFPLLPWFRRLADRRRHGKLDATDYQIAGTTDSHSLAPPHVCQKQSSLLLSFYFC